MTTVSNYDEYAYKVWKAVVTDKEFTGSSSVRMTVYTPDSYEVLGFDIRAGVECACGCNALIKFNQPVHLPLDIISGVVMFGTDVLRPNCYYGLMDRGVDIERKLRDTAGSKDNP